MLLKRHCWLCLSLAATSPYITSEQHGDRTGTHSAHCFSLATLRHASRDKQIPIVPCACHLMKSGNPPRPARPMQSRARRRLVPAACYRTIRCGLLCTVTKYFSLFYPTTDPCVFLPLSVSNHSPVVWLIQTASVISVRPSSAATTHCSSCYNLLSSKGSLTCLKIFSNRALFLLILH